MSMNNPSERSRSWESAEEPFRLQGTNRRTALAGLAQGLLAGNRLLLPKAGTLNGLSCRSCCHFMPSASIRVEHCRRIMRR